MDNINENMNIMTILEIQGIKCSARSFQIEIELKQMLVLNPVNIFDKCLLTKKTSEVINSNSIKIEEKENNDLEKIENNTEVDSLLNNVIHDNNNDNNNNDNDITTNSNDDKEVIMKSDEVIHENMNSEENTLEQKEQETIENNEVKITETTENKISNGLEEVSIPLEDLSEDDKVQLKQRNEVYYEMYREARRKAKIARNLALSSYLEAKRIKNTYMLDDLKDSDDSDLDIDVDLEEE
jgi:hypothetical protein